MPRVQRSYDHRLRDLVRRTGDLTLATTVGGPRFDFGREVFGNLVDMAIFGLPPSAGMGAGLPDVACVMRVNDTDHTRALWDLVFEIAHAYVMGDFSVGRLLGQDGPSWNHGLDERTILGTPQEPMFAG